MKYAWDINTMKNNLTSCITCIKLMISSEITMFQPSIISGLKIP